MSVKCRVKGKAYEMTLQAKGPEPGIGFQERKTGSNCCRQSSSKKKK